MRPKKEKTTKRRRYEPLCDPAWLEGVKELCLEGIPLSRLSSALEARGLHSVDPRTVQGYIRGGRIPGVTEEMYLQARCDRREKARKSKPKPLPPVWDTAIGRMMAEGWSLSEISMEAKRRGLKPSSTYAISKRLADGQISGQTQERYEEAKQARKARLFSQWCETVRPMLLSGCSIAAVERRLVQTKQRYASETTIRTFLYAGKIEGVTAEQYRAAVQRRQGATCPAPVRLAFVQGNSPDSMTQGCEEG